MQTPAAPFRPRSPSAGPGADSNSHVLVGEKRNSTEQWRPYAARGLAKWTESASGAAAGATSSLPPLRGCTPLQTASRLARPFGRERTRTRPEKETAQGTERENATAEKSPLASATLWPLPLAARGNRRVRHGEALASSSGGGRRARESERIHGKTATAQVRPVFNVSFLASPARSLAAGRLPLSARQRWQPNAAPRHF